MVYVLRMSKDRQLGKEVFTSLLGGAMATSFLGTSLATTLHSILRTKYNLLGSHHKYHDRTTNSQLINLLIKHAQAQFFTAKVTYASGCPD